MKRWMPASSSRLGERGQITLEAILILAILTGVAVYSTKYMRSEKILASIVEGPWLPVRGMIEDGVWKNAGDSKNYNPNLLLKRHGTVQGEPAE
jgi:hypothetical protein